MSYTDPPSPTGAEPETAPQPAKRPRMSGRRTIDLLSAIGVLATIAGFTYAGWASLSQNTGKHLAYSILGPNSITATDAEIADASVITPTMICVTNTGTENVQPGDFADNAPIRFDFGDQVRIQRVIESAHPKQIVIPIHQDEHSVSIGPMTVEGHTRLGFVIVAQGSPYAATHPTVTGHLTNQSETERLDPIALTHPAYVTLRCLAAACLALPCLLPLLSGWLRSRKRFSSHSASAREHAYSILLASTLTTLVLVAIDVWAWRWLDSIAAMLDGLSQLLSP